MKMGKMLKSIYFLADLVSKANTNFGKVWIPLRLDMFADEKECYRRKLGFKKNGFKRKRLG